MSVTTSIKRAPKWAWYTTGGIAAGSLAIKVWKGRGKDAKDPTAADAIDTNGTGGAIGSAPSPIPGVIVPPVILGNQGGDSSSDSLAGLFVGAVGDIVHGWQDVWGPVQSNNQAILGTLLQSNQDMGAWLQHQAETSPTTTAGIINDAVTAARATAGSAPQPAASNPVVVNPPPPQVLPPPVKYTHTVDNGKSGKDRRVWCMCGDHKVADGNCWAEGRVCT